MRELNFRVDDQLLRKQPGCDFSKIVAGSVGYLKAKFYFSGNAWDDCVKVASFWNEGQAYNVRLDENDSCDIHPEALTGKEFGVSVTGGRPDGYRITTNNFKVKQEVY